MKPRHFWGLLFVEKEGEKAREDYKRTGLTNREKDELLALIGKG